MRLLVLSFIIAILPLTAIFGQNANNNIAITANTGLNFTCNSISTIENDQTLSNAITVTVKSRNNSCSIYARISSFLGPSGFSTSTYPIQLDYVSTNSNKYANLITAPLTLTSVNQRLFTQTSTTSTFNYYYNLIFKATNYDFPVGNYNFTITFTMTQP